MTDHLTTIARDVAALRDEHVEPAQVLALAARVEAFAAAHPEWEPGGHTRLLTQVARLVDPTCPVDVTTARSVLALVDVGGQWADARDVERDVAERVHAAIRDAAAVGVPETRIAELAHCDRMTVRRALGKR